MGSFNSDKQYVNVEAPTDLLKSITIKCRFRGIPWIAKYDPSNRYQFKWSYDEPIARGDLARIQTEHDRMKFKFQNVKDNSDPQTNPAAAIAKKNDKRKKKNKKKGKIGKIKNIMKSMKIKKIKMIMKIKKNAAEERRPSQRSGRALRRSAKIRRSRRRTRKRSRRTRTSERSESKLFDLDRSEKRKNRARPQS